jgi:hypothetical protein
MRTPESIFGKSSVSRVHVHFAISNSRKGSCGEVVRATQWFHIRAKTATILPSVMGKIPEEFEVGGRERKVGELLGNVNEAVVVVEVEAYPEPKALLPDELAGLKRRLGTDRKVAEHIGGSRAFVTENLPPS